MLVGLPPHPKLTNTSAVACVAHAQETARSAMSLDISVQDMSLPSIHRQAIWKQNHPTNSTTRRSVATSPLQLWSCTMLRFRIEQHQRSVLPQGYKLAARKLMVSKTMELWTLFSKNNLAKRTVSDFPKKPVGPHWKLTSPTMFIFPT